MIDELYSASAHWTWWIIPYFFLGGIAGGCYFISAMLDLVGDRDDRHLSRIGYLVAFPAISIGLLFLVLDLNQPLRFWHMLLRREDFIPMPFAFKWWSPISYGSWVISVFSGFAFVSFLAALVRPGDTPRRGPLGLFQKIHSGLGVFSKLFVLLGAIAGLWTTSYTGALLSVTNRPIWANTNLLSVLFLVSGLSTAAALMYLLGRRRRSVSEDALHRLTRFDDLSLGVELIVILGTLATLAAVLGGLPSDWALTWGMVLGVTLLAVIVFGIIVPLAIGLRQSGGRSLVLASTLVLLGGLFLRAVVVFSAETMEKLG